MRGKKTLLNTLIGLLEEIIAIICGFILPHLILTGFGSKYNGLMTSITQFLSCAVLLRSGVGGATRAALYKPLANKNKDEINSIIKATDIFMKKIGFILAGIIILFAAIYPVFVKNQFNWLFTFTLFIIIGASTFAESFFGITYLVLLQADQRLWISCLIKSICTILNTLLAAILILNNYSIHTVKLASSFVFVLYPIILRYYVKKTYQINDNVKPNNVAIEQRWDAFWHQVASFVMSNTDVLILTAFTNILEVSVYSVYSLVVNGLKRGIMSFANGLEAAFGNIIANNEEKALMENVSIIEYIIYSVSTIVYTSAILLILQFVSVYTKGINDVNYLRPVFAYILLIAQFFNGIRLPYQLVVQAAGHYKQTKIGAIIEPIINLGISLILVIKFGLSGVAIGTLVATIFRTIQYSIYMCKNIVNRSQYITLFKCLIAFFEAGLIFIIVDRLHLNMPQNYFQWCINAVFVVSVGCIVVGVGSILFYRKDINLFIYKLKNMSKKKKLNSVLM